MQIQEMDIAEAEAEEFDDEAAAFLRHVEQAGVEAKKKEQEKSDQEKKVEIPEEFYSNFLKDVENLAFTTIDEYFSKREMHVGGPIPKSFLKNPDYITMILNTDICDGADRAYEAINESGRFDEKTGEIIGEDIKLVIGEDIKLVVGLVHSIEREVPRAFVSGILLMHLELIEGVEL